MWYTARTNAKKQKESAYSNVIKEFGAQTHDGNYDKALKGLQSAIGQAQTKEQKVELYGYLASAAMNAGDGVKALHYYDIRHGLDPNTAKQDGLPLGSYYHRLGNKEEALKQYKMALAYYSSLPQDSFNTGNNIVLDLQSKIEILEAQ